MSRFAKSREKLTCYPHAVCAEGSAAETNVTPPHYCTTKLFFLQKLLP